MTYSFAQQKKAWSNPPIDDVGYISSKDLLAMPEGEFMLLMAKAEKNRYSGWRNWRGKWRDVLGLDSTSGMSVLDYGCGAGFEALQYARNKNIVNLADIVLNNLKVAKRTLMVNGYRTGDILRIKEDAPLILDKRVDIVHCSGVLHHIPNPIPVVRALAQYTLTAGGEFRLMLYSDKAWTISTGTEPPEEVEGHPKAFQFARAWDAVGNYADWYDADRLTKRFGRWFTLERYEELTANGAYVGAVMRKKDKR
jgi:SAM-dependent methyltransferase